jgi:hypothetical protein
MHQPGQAWSLLAAQAIGVDVGYPGWLRVRLVDAAGTSWSFVDRATNLVGGADPVPASFPAPAHLRCRVHRVERDDQGRELLVVTISVESVDTLRRGDEFRVLPEQVTSPGTQWRSGTVGYEAGALDAIEPAARLVLSQHDLPRAVITIFTADPVPAQLVDPSGARLVRIGRTREEDLVCLALDDLSICAVDAGSHEVLSTINTSLSAFIACLGVCENGYPFALHGGDYDDDDVYGDPESLAAETVRKAFEELDPTAFDSSGFWVGFLSDVRSGDHCD